MRFWDASAIAALLTGDVHAADALARYRRDPDIVAWWGSSIECVSAISRLERANELSAADVRVALERLGELQRRWSEVLPSDVVRRIAERLLRVHPLRAADSLQLAAAIVAADRDPKGLPFVCFDARLADAATREGFEVGD